MFCWNSHFVFVPRLSTKLKARLPAGVMRPRSSRSLHLSIFSLVQWLFLRRGDSLCASLPSGSFFNVLSIHPKHRASSTTSIYGSMPGGGVLLLLMTTQHSFSLEWFSFSQALSCDRSEYSNSVVISMVSPYLFRETDDFHPTFLGFLPTFYLRLSRICNLQIANLVCILREVNELWWIFHIIWLVLGCKFHIIRLIFGGIFHIFLILSHAECKKSCPG